jgi:hypothetical protein
MLTIPLKTKGKKKKQQQGEPPATKEILHDVNGEAPAGSVTAIMGPTGAFVCLLCVYGLGWWTAPSRRRN